MKIPTDVLAVLRAANTDGTRLELTGPQMDPRLYQRVNEVIEAVGGTWDKAARAHLFAGDAAEALAPVLASGQVVTLREARQAAQFFPTPAPVVARLLELADVEPGMEVLEPSAGRGAIVAGLLSLGAVVDCIEQDPDHAAMLAGVTARSVTVRDFLAVPPQPVYDRIVMNPPFTQQADVAHVTHALRFLKPDGVLVSVMSWAATYGDGPAAGFRALVEARGGSVEALPDGAFAESLTGVSTVIVTIPATRPADVVPLVWPVREQPAPVEDEHRDPAEIAAEIGASLREALAIFDRLAADLAKPKALPVPVVASLPRQSRHPDQLSFEDLNASA